MLSLLLANRRLLMSFLFTVGAISVHAVLEVSASSSDSITIDIAEQNTIRKVRNVSPNKALRWTNGTIPYIIDDNLVQYTNLIESAMDNFRIPTCIKFVPRTLQDNFIRYVLDEKCLGKRAIVGMVGGEQRVYLAADCMFKGRIMHLLGHGLGFFNMQSRSDRDEYIDVYWENIQPGMEHEFLLLEPDANLVLGDFDFDSIMMDGNLMVSKDGRSFTMAAKDGRRLPEVSSKLAISGGDVDRIKEIYNC